MKVVCIVQARMGSSRLPGKVMKKICGKTVLEHDIDRLSRVKNIDEIIIATTTSIIDDIIVNEAKRLGIKYFRGSENDVLSRYYFAAKQSNADVVVRVTSDCPLLDSKVTQDTINMYLNNSSSYDYVSNTLERTFPRGLDTEVFSFRALEKAFNEAKSQRDREHVTPYIWDNNDKFKNYFYRSNYDYSKYRWTLDTEEDYELISKIYDELYAENNCFGMTDILSLFEKNPELIYINSKVKQKTIKSRKMSNTIEDKLFNRDRPCYIIAEMSANHGGNINKAIEIVKAAKEAGADCIKTQTYTADTLTINCDNEYFRINDGNWKGETLYSLYQKAYTPWEWQGKLKEEADKIGIDFLSTPFDKTAVDFLESIDVEFYKIASFEIVDIPLIEYVASKGKPIIISTGMSTKDEINDAINAIKKYNNKNICILKCSSAYPSITDNMNLRSIIELKEKFNVPVGLSDHSLGYISATTAVALGAKVIEKHFCITRKEETADSSFSMELEEFKTMVNSIRQTEKAMGKIFFGATEQEKKSKIFRKSIFIIEDVKKGQTITEENIRVIRPGYGLMPKYYTKVIGKTFNSDIKRGTPLLWEMIKEE